MLQTFFTQAGISQAQTDHELRLLIRDLIRLYSQLECLVKEIKTLPRITNMLDVGCHFGYITALVKAISIPLRTTAIDPFYESQDGYDSTDVDHENVGKSKHYIPLFLPQVSFYQCSLQQYAQTATTKHDLIIINGYGVPPKETAKFFKALAQLLTPDGKVIITYYEYNRFSEDVAGYRLSSLVYAAFNNIKWGRAYPGEVNSHLYTILPEEITKCSPQDRRYLLDTIMDSGVFYCILSKPRPLVEIDRLLQLSADTLRFKSLRQAIAYLTPTDVIDNPLLFFPPPIFISATTSFSYSIPSFPDKTIIAKDEKYSSPTTSCLDHITFDPEYLCANLYPQ